MEEKSPGTVLGFIVAVRRNNHTHSISQAFPAGLFFTGHRRAFVRFFSEEGRGRPVAEAPPLSDGCKPDSVQPATLAAGLDGHLSRRRGSRTGGGSLRNGDQYPEGSPLARRSGRRPGPSCSVLHRMGFFVPPRLRSGRWALTPPFHPYPPACARGRFVFCDTVRRPGLSHRPPARSTRHAALWCPDFPLPPRLAAQRERPSAIGLKIKPDRHGGKVRFRQPGAPPVRRVVHGKHSHHWRLEWNRG